MLISTVYAVNHYYSPTTATCPPLFLNYFSHFSVNNSKYTTTLPLSQNTQRTICGLYNTTLPLLAMVLHYYKH